VQPARPTERLTTPAGWDPGRHKRGTNPCLPRGWKKHSRRAAANQERFRAWIKEQSRLWDERNPPEVVLGRLGRGWDD
jgi:hypothetical protein